jgi:hypothetical protein
MVAIAEDPDLSESWDGPRDMVELIAKYDVNRVLASHYFIVFLPSEYGTDISCYSIDGKLHGPSFFLSGSNETKYAEFPNQVITSYTYWHKEKAVNGIIEHIFSNRAEYYNTSGDFLGYHSEIHETHADIFDAINASILGRKELSTITDHLRISNSHYFVFVRCVPDDPLSDVMQIPLDTRKWVAFDLEIDRIVAEGSRLDVEHAAGLEPDALRRPWRNPDCGELYGQKILVACFPSLYEWYSLIPERHELWLTGGTNDFGMLINDDHRMYGRALRSEDLMNLGSSGKPRRIYRSSVYRKPLVPFEANSNKFHGILSTEHA